MTETNRIEYKQELTNGLEKEAVAFLNYKDGGVVYIGIDKQSNIVGVSDTDGDMLKIKDRLKNNILPSCMGLFDVSPEEREGKDIIKITLASGSEKPYYIKKKGMSEKGCFIRIGTAAEPMPVRMIEDFFSKRTRNSISKIKSNQQNLSFEQLKIYYEALGMQLNSNFATNLELLTEEGKYNYVAYLMADKNGTSIKVAKYSGTNRVDLIESNEYGYESLIKATKSVLDKINLENKTLTKITSKEREEQRIWNPIALREAIINAIVHNDFTKEVPPKFEIFDDRIEITSAGGLPEGLSQDDFFEGVSVPRNKEIMRIYKDLDLVEHLGSGVPRILQSYDKKCFKFLDNFLRMSFPSAIKRTQASDKDNNQEGGAISSPIGGSIDEIRKEFGLVSERVQMSKEENITFLRSAHGVYTEYIRSNFGVTSEMLRNNFGITSEKKIPKAIMTLQLIALVPAITAEEIGQLIGVSSRSAETYLQKLKEANLIERIGSKKEGYWDIINQIINYL